MISTGDQNFIALSRVHLAWLSVLLCAYPSYYFELVSPLLFYVFRWLQSLPSCLFALGV